MQDFFIRDILENGKVVYEKWIPGNCRDYPSATKEKAQEAIECAEKIGKEIADQIRSASTFT